MNIAVRTTSIMSSAMLSVPSVTRQPARSSSSMRAARGDGGIDRDGGAGGAQRGFLLCGHAAAVGGDQARGQQAAARDVLDRRDAALLVNGRDLAPDLAEMERGERVELVLELAHEPEARIRQRLRVALELGALL